MAASVNAGSGDESDRDIVEQPVLADARVQKHGPRSPGGAQRLGIHRLDVLELDRHADVAADERRRPDRLGRASLRVALPLDLLETPEQLFVRWRRRAAADSARDRDARSVIVSCTTPMSSFKSCCTVPFATVNRLVNESNPGSRASSW